HTIEVNAGYYIQAFSAVLAIFTLIFQPDGLGTITAPIGRWLRGERFQLAHGGGALGRGGGGGARPWPGLPAVGGARQARRRRARRGGRARAAGHRGVLRLRRV